MSNTSRLRVLAATGAIALAAGGAMLTPAGAAGMQPLLKALAVVSCTGTGPCQEYDNTAGGSGLKGTSAKGNGLVGVTNYNKSGATTGSAGVSGTDTATKNYKNSGVLGTSTIGLGVSGVSTSNSGVSGSSTNYVGVNGIGAVSGVFGTVTGVNSGGYPQGGVEGVDAVNSGANAGVFGVSLNGTGAIAQSQNYLGLAASGLYGGAFNASDVGLFVNAGNMGIQLQDSGGIGIQVLQGSGNVQAPLVLSSGVTGNPFADSFEAFDHAGTLLMKLTDTGDISIVGQIFTSGVCSSGCITNNRQDRRVVSYAPTEAEPTREDTGTAQLVGGKAYVRLDPAFANVIDTRRAYAVLITPEGDSRGLYVDSKSKDGFTVRENMGGTSTLTFDYRIVAKPYGVNAPRLPMVTLPHAPSPHPRPTHGPLLGPVQLPHP